MVREYQYIELIDNFSSPVARIQTLKFRLSYYFNNGSIIVQMNIAFLKGNVKYEGSVK